MAPPINVELKANERPVDAINAARSEIKSLQQRLTQVCTAPLPKSDAKKLAEQFVAQMLSTGRPAVAIVRDELKVTPRRHSGRRGCAGADVLVRA